MFYIIWDGWKLTDTPIASLHAGEQVDAQSGVLVVCSDLLLDFPRVACVSARAIVGKSLRASELVVGAGSRDDVAVRGDLAGETLYRAGHWMLSVGVTCMEGNCSQPAGSKTSRVLNIANIILTLVDLAEHHNTWELGLRVVRDLWVEGEDTHATAILGGHIFEGLLNQHGG